MAKTLRALVQAGGGNYTNSGGGGAGGHQDVDGIIVDAQDYPVIVGAAQEDSSFGDLLTSLAGGDGGSDNGTSTSASPGEAGGSGGGGGGKGNGSGGPGAGGPGTVGQGNNGGAGAESTSSGSGVGNDGGGGGGGANSAGTNAASRRGGNGGAPKSSDITGTPVNYGEGGGGRGGSMGDGTGGGAQPNTGNGGNPSSVVGATGIVVLRYLTSQFGKCTGGTITTDGLYTIHTFTSSGTFSVTDVTTNPVTAIGFTDATGNGDVHVAIGVTIVERGVVWALTANPTTADGKASVAGTSGAYTAPITGLNSNTLYHVRAYIIDSIGTITYGADVIFTTANIANNKLYKDLGAEDGDIFAVRFTIGGTLGSVDVQLGDTSTAQNVLATAGTVTLVGTYAGVHGLIFAASATFNGYIDDVMFVKLLSADQLALINWAAEALVTPIAISSSVVFKRVEDEEFNRFRIFRYLNSLFKDVDGYVTVTIRKEANDGVVVKTGTFFVGNVDSNASPFVKKKISFLAKVQALLVGYSNANLNDQMIITKFQLFGSEEPQKLFDGGRIISID